MCVWKNNSSKASFLTWHTYTRKTITVHTVWCNCPLSGILYLFYSTSPPLSFCLSCLFRQTKLNWKPIVFKHACVHIAAAVILYMTGAISQTHRTHWCTTLIWGLTYWHITESHTGHHSTLLLSWFPFFSPSCLTLSLFFLWCLISW